MKVLKRNLPITLFGQTTLCDLLLGSYAEKPHRPAIVLMTARPEDFPEDEAFFSEPYGKASANAPEEFIQHLSPEHFPAKNWSENAGLWEQLLELSDEDELPLFHPTQHSITLGFCQAPIVMLGATALDLYLDLCAERLEAFPHG